MAFNYALSAEQQTPTSDSKVVLCKSFKIDIAAGSGFTTATTYNLGWLPKDAQVVSAAVITTTAVSGGTVSAATLSTQVGGGTVVTAANVFAQSYTNANSFAYTTDLPTTQRLKVALLIRWHMWPYVVEKSNNPNKTVSKIQSLLGNSTWEQIMVLNACDRQAH